MTIEPITPEPDDIDKMENLFDERPTNRLVWIVPSVLLHVIIIGLWMMMPEEEPRIVKERELVIKSEQAKQLKQFVEEINIITNQYFILCHYYSSYGMSKYLFINLFKYRSQAVRTFAESSMTVSS